MFYRLIGLKSFIVSVALTLTLIVSKNCLFTVIQGNIKGGVTEKQCFTIQVKCSEIHSKFIICISMEGHTYFLNPNGGGMIVPSLFSDFSENPKKKYFFPSVFR